MWFRKQEVMEKRFFRVSDIATVDTRPTAILA